MTYLIIAHDHDGKEELRENLREKHREHLQRAGRSLLASGACLDDETGKIIGGLSILDTDDRQAAEAFASEDPYSQAGIRKTTKIIRWRRRWANGHFLGDGVSEIP